MTIRLNISWRLKLIAVVGITIAGLMTVTGLSFVAFHNINLGVVTLQKATHFKTLSTQLSLDLLQVELESERLKSSNINSILDKLSGIQSLANQLKLDASVFNNKELLNLATRTSSTLEGFIGLRKQWLSISKQIGPDHSQGETGKLEQVAAQIKQNSMSMVKNETSDLMAAHQAFLLGPSPKNQQAILNALGLYDQKVARLEWQNNAIGQAVAKYRTIFNQLSALIENRNSIQTQDSKLSATLKQTLLEQQTFIDSRLIPQAKRESQSIQATAGKIIISVSVLIGLILLISLGGIARQLNIQLSEMRRFLQHLSQGDFTHKLSLNNNPKDEFTLLRTSNNQMTNDVASVMKSVKESSKNLSNSRLALDRMIEELSKGTREADETVKQALEATSQISTAVNDAAKRAIQVGEKSRSAATATQNGSELVSQFVFSMDDITGLIEETVKEVELLSHASQKMHGIIDVINTLADQTNLLALNAAIESARAGEAGRGFAVVADEVRSLAQKTVDSTSSIASIVDGINTHSQRMQDLMNKGKTLVYSGQEKANRAKEAFLEINNDVHASSIEVDQIVVAIEEISHNAEEISSQIRHMSQQSDASIQIRIELEKQNSGLSDQTHLLDKVTEKFKF